MINETSFSSALTNATLPCSYPFRIFPWRSLFLAHCFDHVTSLFTSLCCPPPPNCIKHKLLVFTFKALQRLYLCYQSSLFLCQDAEPHLQGANNASFHHTLVIFFKQAPFHCHTFCPSLLGENICRDTSLYVFKSFLNFSFFSEVCKSPKNCPAAARVRPLPNMLTGIKLLILNLFCMQVSPPLQHVSCKLFGLWIVFLICVCTACSTTQSWPLPYSMEVKQKSGEWDVRERVNQFTSINW